MRILATYVIITLCLKLEQIVELSSLFDFSVNEVLIQLGDQQQRELNGFLKSLLVLVIILICFCKTRNLL